MSAQITTLDHGYVGCNFCGRITCHNASKPSIIWVSCKNCKYVSRLSGNPIQNNGRERTCPYTKAPVVNLKYPDNSSQYQTVPPELVNSNNNNLLNYKPDENRLLPVKISVTTPNYATACSLAGVTLTSENSDDDDYDY